MEDETVWYRPQSADVETSAYALLTVLEMESSVSAKIAAALPIVRWLSKQRNSRGGFGSTQVLIIII